MTQEEEDEQTQLLSYQQQVCQVLMQNGSNYKAERCLMVWDGIFCWPSADPGETVVVPCPGYIHGFNSESTASKHCTFSGTWWHDPVIQQPWTNYSQCPFPQWEYPIGINSSVFGPHVPNIKYISKVGYSFSFSTLLVAFCILISIRRLRCPRNKLHLHLFLSFMMRAFMLMLKEFLYQDGMDLQGPRASYDGLQVVLDWDTSIGCRIFTSFLQYFLMANYTWILMEGLYLHNLIFLAMFTDTSSISKYVLAGWGTPALLAIPWVVVRATLENTLCWTTNDTSAYFWIIRGPITFSIILNFALFVNITRVLFSKMFSSQASSGRHYRYRKWFKSTLVLVPLFGVHYALLLAMSLAAGSHEVVEITWLYVDQLFSSFQGTLVAFLYCFLNSEVQSELRRSCSPFMFLLTPGGQEVNSTSACTQSLSLLSRTGKGSMQSLHSARSTTCSTEKQPPLPMKERTGEKAIVILKCAKTDRNTEDSQL